LNSEKPKRKNVKEEEKEKPQGLLPICSHCKKIRDREGCWSDLETYFSKYFQVKFTHSLCPDCLTGLHPEYAGELPQEKE